MAERRINDCTKDWMGTQLRDQNRIKKLLAGPSASTLKEYLESGGSPESWIYRDGNWNTRMTLLGCAVDGDKKEHVKLLLEYHANPNLLVQAFSHFFLRLFPKIFSCWVSRFTKQ
eukprot:TRINITY_DN10050_c0_g1_i1.p1 TRINITY_DN10050_c0_g1~~TRINITY_DN10050_c0_g1_i1.p1  ORF type:complete len:115 (-),score=27.00 TRINITY_DN10050_c0_g1_i1:282-626(-)